jgi:hypothetical protein
MRRFRIPHILMTGAVGALTTALTVAAVGCGPDKATVIAAGWLVDAVLIVSGTVLSALTGLAGVLLAADMRSDSRCDQAWQCNNELSALAIEVPANPNPTVGWELDYATGPQDERLRAIFRAHRFATPMTTLAADRVVAAVGSASNAAEEQALASIDADIPVSSAILDAETVETTVRKHGRALIVNDATINERGMRAMRGRPPRLVRSMSTVPNVRRFANAGQWWSAQVVGAELASSSSAFSGCAADVVVMADRDSRNHPPSPPDNSIDATALAQPACRGPPSGATIGRLSSTQSPFGMRHRAKVDAASELDALVVVDNLGERVPVRAAELDVLEMYLDEVLSELFAAAGTNRNGRTS